MPPSSEVHKKRFGPFRLKKSKRTYPCRSPPARDPPPPGIVEDPAQHRVVGGGRGRGREASSGARGKGHRNNLEAFSQAHPEAGGGSAGEAGMGQTPGRGSSPAPPIAL
jgi:hypothetical protein